MFYASHALKAARFLNDKYQEANVKKFVIALFFGLTFMYAFLAVPVQAQSGGSCDATIIDQPGKIADPAMVRTAIEGLESEGAVVRVRVIDTFGAAANLDLYFDSALADCKSWQGANGFKRPNLIVIYVEMAHRKVGLYYGEVWTAELNAKWPGILSHKVSPFLKAGDFSSAIATGLNQVTQTIQLTTALPGSGTVVVQQSEPTDITGLWPILWALVALAVVVGGVFGFFWYRKREARRRAAQQSAQTERGLCTGAINKLKQVLVLLESRIMNLESVFPESQITSWETMHRKLEADFGITSTKYVDLRIDPDDTGLSEEEYLQMAKRYSGVNNRFDSLRAEINSLEGAIEGLKELSDNIAEILENAQDILDSASERITAVESQGFKVESFSETLTRCGKKLANAIQQNELKEFTSAKQIAEDAVEAATLAAENADKLPAVQSGLTDALSTLSIDLSHTFAAIEAGRHTYQALAAEYASASIESVVGNGSEAEKHYLSAEAANKIAGDKLTEQAWEAAQKQIDSATSSLASAKSLIRSIRTLKENLDAAKDNAPEEITEAFADIETARKFVCEYDEETRDEHFSSLDKAHDIAKEAEELLRLPKPEYLRIVHLADQANDIADRDLAEARDELETVNRLRKKLATNIRNAASSVKIAGEYIDDHSRDVTAKTWELHASAVKLLDKAYALGDAAETIEEAVELAKKADDEADKSLLRARSDFESAENAREASRRESSPWDDSYSGDESDTSSSFSWGSSSSSGGGGSSSWSSSSSSGGGGSTGW